MAEIRPFRALRFTKAAGSLEQLLCPPYDIISEQQRQEYLKTNPNNIIRLELPREGENPYATASNVLKNMLANGVLQRDDTAALYIYEIQFTIEKNPDFQYRLHGIVGQVHLEEFDKGIVLPHEETLSKAKEDLLNLMKATGCNFSNVYSLYNDESGKVEAVLSAKMKEEPLCEVTDEAGLIHRLWALTDVDDLQTVCAQFVDTKLYIADGHHRYETAINYRNYLRTQGVPVGADSDYIMMMVVEMSHPGLVVFPTHRLLKDLPNFSAENVVAACAEDFKAEEVSLADLDARLDAAYEAGEKAFGFYVGGEKATLLTLKDITVMDRALPDLSVASRRLDVNVLHTLILERLLGIDKANMAQQINLTYTRSLDEAIDGVNSGVYQGTFILNPTRVSEIRDVAAEGEKMPQKSTYFYPKLITGLTMNQLL